MIAVNDDDDGDDCNNGDSDDEDCNNGDSDCNDVMMIAMIVEVMFMA